MCFRNTTSTRRYAYYCLLCVFASSIFVFSQTVNLGRRGWEEAWREGRIKQYAVPRLTLTAAPQPYHKTLPSRTLHAMLFSKHVVSAAALLGFVTCNAFFAGRLSVPKASVGERACQVQYKNSIISVCESTL